MNLLRPPQSLLAVSAFVTLTPLTVGQVGAEKPLQGYLLATSDIRVIAKAERTVPTSATRATFDKVFSSEQFRLVPWGEDRLIVIDLTNGPLGKLRDEMLVTRAFLEKRESDGTIDVSHLTPEENRAAQGALGGSWMSIPGRPPHPPTFVGIDRFVRVELSMGGKTKSVRLPMSAIRADPLLDHLRKRFDLQKGSSPVPDDPSRRDETILLYAGSARKAAPEGTLAYAKALEPMQKEMADKTREAALELLKALGASGLDDPGQIGSVSGMPEELRNGLRQLLGTSWKAYGFSSSDEAMSFLTNGDGYRAWTDLGICQLLDPGDPSQHIPAATGGGRFTSVPGYYP